jgi:hypothetical protein
VPVTLATGQVPQRSVRLTVANLDGTTALQSSGLRVRFKVKKTLRFEPSTAEIEIYNLNRAHRSQLKTRGAAVILEAGYTPGVVAQIFSGNARTIDHKSVRPDWLSKIQCGDGEQAYQFAHLAKGYAGGTDLGTIVKDLVGQLGAATSDTISSIAKMVGINFPNGHAVSGKVSRSLTEVLAGHGFEWSIQDGKVQVLPNGKATTETAALISPTTGLIGSPQHGTPNWQFIRDQSHRVLFKCMLAPTIKPGGLISLQSAEITGLFRCFTVEHSGDTHGDEWVSEVEATPTS